MSNQLPDGFEINQKMREWAASKVPTLDIDYYHEEFCDHWLSNGKKKKDWEATWRNWMRRTDNGSAPGVRLNQVRRLSFSGTNVVNMTDGMRKTIDNLQDFVNGK